VSTSQRDCSNDDEGYLTNRPTASLHQGKPVLNLCLRSNVSIVLSHVSRCAADRVSMSLLIKIEQHHDKLVVIPSGMHFSFERSTKRTL
jgi:hypothetical protein